MNTLFIFPKEDPEKIAEPGLTEKRVYVKKRQAEKSEERSICKLNVIIKTGPNYFLIAQGAISFFFLA